MMSLEDKLGQFFVKGLREEPLNSYFRLKENALKHYIPDHFNEELRKKRSDQYAIFQSLNEEQLEQLDALVKSMTDSAAFLILREIQEAMDGCADTEKIDLTIEGQRATDLDLLSGTLFGEYLLWTEKFSKYGEVEY